MKKNVQISDSEKTIIIEGIRRIFPLAKINVFGSRVTGGSKKYSDLDIAIDLGFPADFVKLAELKEYFSESSLPFKVDLSDFRLMDDAFRTHVLENCIEW